MNNSKRRVEKHVWEKIFVLFFEAVGNQPKREIFETILSGIMSPAEKTMIAKRTAIMYLLLKGIDTSTICTTLKVTRTTVAKCVLMLNTNTLLKKELNKVIRTDRLKNLFFELITSVLAPGHPGVNWSAASRRQQILERHKRTGM